MRNDAISVLGLKQAEQAKAAHRTPENKALLQKAVLSVDVKQQNLYSNVYEVVKIQIIYLQV